MFGGPVRKSSEWSGLPGSGKKYRRSLGEGDMMMMGPDGMGMFMMSRMSKDDMDGYVRRLLSCAPVLSSRPRFLGFSLPRVFASAFSSFACAASPETYS